jgi:hypothetical protein
LSFQRNPGWVEGVLGGPLAKYSSFRIASLEDIF